MLRYGRSFAALRSCARLFQMSVSARLAGPIALRFNAACNHVFRSISRNASNSGFPQNSQAASAELSATDLEKLQALSKGVAPSSGRPLSEIAAEVWGHNRNPVGPGHRSGAKILRRPLKGPLYMSWYPPPPSSYSLNPYRLTPKQERWRAKLKMLRAVGKGPPKKGAGKRSK